MELKEKVMAIDGKKRFLLLFKCVSFINNAGEMTHSDFHCWVENNLFSLYFNLYVIVFLENYSLGCFFSLISHNMTAFEREILANLLSLQISVCRK